MFALVAVALLMVIAELVLAWFTPPIDENFTLKLPDGFLDQHTGYRADHELFWRPTSGFTGVWDDTPIFINSRGLRDREFPKQKPGNTFRILSLGESGTFGVRVPIDQTYNRVLEKLLNARGGSIHYQVINAGVASYTSFQGRLYLEQEGLDFDPDLVLVYFGQNDSLPTYFEDRITQTNAFGIPTYGRGLTDKQIRQYRLRAKNVQSKLNRFALYRNLASLVLWVEHFWNREQSELPTVRVPQKDRKENYERIEILAHAHGAKVLNLITPYFDHPVPLPDEFRKGQGRHVCDLWTGIHRNQNQYGELFLDDVHPTPLGHALIGRTIFECLKAQQLLPES